MGSRPPRRAPSVNGGDDLLLGVAAGGTDDHPEQRSVGRLPRPPEDDDEAVKAMTLAGVPGLTHDRHDLIDRRWIGRIATALVPRRPPGVMAGQRRRRSPTTGNINQLNG